MTLLEIILIGILWLLVIILCVCKQAKAETGEKGYLFVVFIFAPLWLIGAIIRQVFIEDWK
jgi:hypothetical protein